MKKLQFSNIFKEMGITILSRGNIYTTYLIREEVDPNIMIPNKYIK